MTYDMYRYLFIIAACVSIVFLVLSIVLCIKLKIPQIIGNLTGFSAKKAINRISDDNKIDIYRPGYINYDRGEITDKIATSPIASDPTERLGVDVIGYSEETTILEHYHTQEQDCFEIETDITYIHTDEIVV